MPPRTAIFKKQGSQDDEDVEITGKEFQNTMKLYSHKVSLGFIIFWTICSGAAPLLMNIIMGDMMNVMTQQQGGVAKEIAKLCLKMLGIILAMAACSALNIGFRSWGNPFFLIDLRYAVYHSLMQQDIAYYDQTATGILIGRISEDITLIRETYIDKFCTVVQNLAQAVAGIILALCYSWRVTLSVIVAIPLSCIVFVCGDKWVDKLWLQFSESSSACSEKAEEVITQFRTVKSFDNELLEAELYTKSLYEVDEVYKKTSIAHGLKNGLISALVWAMITALIFESCWAIVKMPSWNVQPGSMMILMMSMMLGTMGISQSLSTIEDFKKASRSAAKVLEIINRVPGIDNKKGDSLPNVRGKVEFRDVAFKYAGREEYAVNHLSFVVNPGETVALVGESGCGKSTTLQLLQRFYDIESGTILLDDVDVRTLSPEFVRSQISIVPQGPVLFSMSIKDNIRYAVPKAADTEVAEAARVGNAHNFIMELPNNYETVVQQTSLSGGQKQRICISRAILANTPILLLDEATAALDTESEQLVQQSLENFRHGKTAIVVAHRLATVMNADRILVFKDGHIEEKGTHKELVEMGGLYSDLVKFQLE